MHSSWLGGLERVPMYSAACVCGCVFFSSPRMRWASGGRAGILEGVGVRDVESNASGDYGSIELTSTSVTPGVVPTDEWRSVLVDRCDGTIIF